MKTIELRMNTGILPIINIGMYESAIDPRCLFDDVEDIVESSTRLSSDDKEFFMDNAYNAFDYEKYKNRINDIALRIIRDYFDGLSSECPFVAVVKESEVWSPPYYNFESDQLDFTLEVLEEDICRIANEAILTYGDDFFIWAANEYKSYDGFISFFPYKKGEFVEAIRGKDIERAVAMWVTYMAHQNDQNGFNDYQMEFEERMLENLYLGDFLDDTAEGRQCLEILETAWAEEEWLQIPGQLAFAM